MLLDTMMLRYYRQAVSGGSDPAVTGGKVKVVFDLTTETCNIVITNLFEGGNP